MESTQVVHNTFTLERNYPYTPEEVFAAFSNPQRKRRWFAEGPRHTVEVFEMDFRMGGAERICSRFGEGTPFSGVVLNSEWFYLDIVSNERIVTASWMVLGEKRISASLVTMELFKTQDGTKLVCTHQGVFYEGADGPEMRKNGWKSLLNSLQKELLQEEA